MKHLFPLIPLTCALGLVAPLCQGALVTHGSSSDTPTAVAAGSPAGDLVTALSPADDPAAASSFTVGVGLPPATSGLLSWLIAAIPTHSGLAPADGNDAAFDLSASLLAPAESPRKTAPADPGEPLLARHEIAAVMVPEPESLLLGASAIGWALLLRRRHHR